MDFDSSGNVLRVIFGVKFLLVAGKIHDILHIGDFSIDIGDLTVKKCLDCVELDASSYEFFPQEFQLTHQIGIACLKLDLRMYSYLNIDLKEDGEFQEKLSEIFSPKEIEQMHPKDYICPYPLLLNSQNDTTRIILLRTICIFTSPDGQEIHSDLRSCGATYTGFNRSEFLRTGVIDCVGVMTI